MTLTAAIAFCVFVPLVTFFLAAGEEALRRLPAQLREEKRAGEVARMNRKW